MSLLRNILTAIWCAIVFGSSVFGLILMVRIHGGDLLRETVLMLHTAELGLLAGFGLMALVSTKYLWAVFAVAVMALLLGLTHDVIVQRVWRPSAMLSGLFLIIPTYLLARWNAAAQTPEFNPVKEF